MSKTNYSNCCCFCCHRCCFGCCCCLRCHCCCFRRLTVVIVVPDAAIERPLSAPPKCHFFFDAHVPVFFDDFLHGIFYILCKSNFYFYFYKDWPLAFARTVSFTHPSINHREKKLTTLEIVMVSLWTKLIYWPKKVHSVHETSSIFSLFSLTACFCLGVLS